jgi:hypothetical protein
MRNILLFIIVVSVLGCWPIKQTKSSNVIKGEEQLGFRTERNKKFREIETGNCLFDQSTQTDKFLKGIKEFENYIWNQETKTANIVLSENETLEIFRGGCNHFELGVKFIYKNEEFNIEKNKNFIKNKILWISKLIEEFDYKEINEVIKNNKISIIKENETSYYLNFMSVELYELYSSNIKVNSDGWEFSFGFYY